MTTKTPRLGFVGFGEVGYHVAKGLKEAGITAICAYNNGSRNRPPYSESFKDRAASIGVELVSSAEELAETADIVFSTVVPKTALAAAGETAPFADRLGLYVDLNACSPMTKRQCARAIFETGGRFVEGQLMSAPIALGHATPIIVSGEAAEELRQLMAPYGTDISVVPGEIGASSMIKMVRDIITKGIMALILEMLLAAKQAELDVDRIPPTPHGFMDIAAHLGGRWVPQTAVHAQRRAGEMEEVIDTLQGLGVEPILAEAIKKRLEWCAGFNLKDYFGGELPPSYQDVFDAIEKLSAARV